MQRLKARYRYYIGQQEGGRTLRIPAAELEGAVATCLANALDDPLELCRRGWLELTPASIGLFAKKAAELAAQFRQRDRAVLRLLVSKVCVQDDCVVVSCDLGVLANTLGVKLANGAAPTLELSSEISLRRSGLAVRLVHSNGAILGSSPSDSVVRLTIKARRWWMELRTGQLDVTRLAAREELTQSYVTRVIRLAFLAPAVVEAIVAGTIKASVDSHLLTATDAVPLSWNEQSKKLLPRR